MGFEKRCDIFISDGLEKRCRNYISSLNLDPRVYRLSQNGIALQIIFINKVISKSSYTKHIFLVLFTFVKSFSTK